MALLGSQLLKCIYVDAEACLQAIPPVQVPPRVSKSKSKPLSNKAVPATNGLSAKEFFAMTTFFEVAQKAKGARLLVRCILSIYTIRSILYY